MNEIGNLIRTLRLQHDMTYAELSRQSGLSGGHLSDIESGRRLPKLDALTCLARVFEMSLPEILGNAALDLSADEWELIHAYRAKNMKSVMRLTLRRMDNELTLKIDDIRARRRA